MIPTLMTYMNAACIYHSDKIIDAEEIWDNKDIILDELHEYLEKFYPTATTRGKVNVLGSCYEKEDMPDILEDNITWLREQYQNEIGV